jgi:signal transduction histidine kinase
MTLRRSSQLLVVVIAFLGVTLASALIVMTTRLNAIVHRVQTSVHNVANSEDIAFELDSVREADHESSRSHHEDRLRELVAEALQYVDSPREGSVLARLATGVERFAAAMRAPDGPGSADAAVAFESALGAARELRHINIDQSRSLVDRAAHWDRLANVFGIAAISVFAIGLGGVIWWLRRRAFTPVIRLVGSIEGYARGDRSARALEIGPSEFRALAHRFNDMTATLERQRNAQLAFLGGVAHDLRNPLSALKMAAEMVGPDQPLPSEERVRQLFARVRRQSDRMERMVYDFLDAARIESGNLGLQLERCDIREVARAVVDLFEPSVRTHRLMLDMPEEPVVLRCDPVRIEQVVTNLVSNAIKYSPRGGRVTVSVARDRSAVVLSVIDEGVGIVPEEVEHVFEPFRRSGASKESIAGVGLGLFVARRIVEAHGGTISVTSAVGRGSTFTVRLPGEAGVAHG